VFLRAGRVLCIRYIKNGLNTGFQNNKKPNKNEREKNVFVGDFEDRIELFADKTTAYDIVKQAALNKLGKFTKADIMELCPTVGRASVENALKKLVEENVLVRHGSGRATFYKKSE
jgi:hypothetical protein